MDLVASAFLDGPWPFLVLSWGLAGLGVFLVLALAYWAVDALWTRPLTPVQGTVMHKDYTPETSHTGIGPVLSSTGGVAVTFSASAARWILLVTVPDGEVHALETSQQRWAQTKEGAHVWCTRHQHRLSGTVAVELADACPGQ